MAGESVWRRRAPVWLRILAGVLIFPTLWVALASLCHATLAAGAHSPVAPWILTVAAIAAGVASWIIVRTSSARIAVGFFAVGLAGIALMSSTLLLKHSSVSESEAPGEGFPAAAGPPHFDVVPSPALPREEAAVPSRPSYGDVTSEPSEGNASPAWSAPDYAGPTPPFTLPDVEPEFPTPSPQASAPPSLPEFPWPPPSASASYVLPDDLFQSYPTVGQVVTALLFSLESNGYVERSFFLTPQGGVALVTRLERIKDDGSPSGERWPSSEGQSNSTEGLLKFLQGLFYVDPGHYRVIVFILQDLPFSQSAQNIAAPEAQSWLSSGGNVLPPEIAKRSFSGGHCTVLVYEFASDGTKVRTVVSSLTGKQHLEKTGLLSALAQLAFKSSH